MKRKLIAVTFATAVAIAGAAAPVTGAFAKIQPVDTACTNNGGQTPTGQQPSCTNTNGLTQQTENQNPAGHAPPGQNP